VIKYGPQGNLRAGNSNTCFYRPIEERIDFDFWVGFVILFKGLSWIILIGMVFQDQGVFRDGLAKGTLDDDHFSLGLYGSFHLLSLGQL